MKSSQKLRHPGTQPRQAHAKQDRGSHVAGDIRTARGGVRKPQSRKSSAGPRYGKGQAPVKSARVPTAPLQLRWFPGNQVRWIDKYQYREYDHGVRILVQPRSVLHPWWTHVPLNRCQQRCPYHNNLSALHACLSCVGCGAQQEFFYHVLLVLDSYTFNCHLKVELVEKIARLYQQLSTFKGRRKGVGNVDERGVASDTSNAAANKGVRGFTGTMVKLKVRLTRIRCEKAAPHLRHD